MIEFKSGDIFETDCNTIVNTVNCVGVMGKGIALECKKRFPEMYTEYVKRCGTKLSKGGDYWFWQNPLFNNNKNLFSVKTKKNPNILCFATKEDWRDNSQLAWIERGLKHFAEHKIEFISRLTGEPKALRIWELYKDEMSSIAFPKLGCTNGKLDWDAVKRLMIQYLDNLPIKIEIYE